MRTKHHAQSREKGLSLDRGTVMAFAEPVKSQIMAILWTAPVSGWFGQKPLLGGLKGPGSIYFRASMHSCPAAPAFTLMAQ
jgi:hypothetical protein